MSIDLYTAQHQINLRNVSSAECTVVNGKNYCERLEEFLSAINGSRTGRNDFFRTSQRLAWYPYP